MESNDPFEQESQLKMQAEITDASRGYLLEIAKWAKFLSIIGFIFAGLMVFGALFMGTIFSNIPEASVAMPFGGSFMAGMYLALAAMYFFPTLYLYRFATRTKSALENFNTDLLTEGLENLKSVFKFWGIVTIVILGIYALIFVGGLFAGLFA